MLNEKIIEKLEDIQPKTILNEMETEKYSKFGCDGCNYICVYSCAVDCGGGLAYSEECLSCPLNCIFSHKDKSFND